MANSESRGTMRSRWWEDYLVRYFTGTLVGMFCVFVLLTEIFFNGDPELLGKKIFFSPEKDSTWWGLFVLILTGGAFCYLASTPITVLHSGRMIREGMNKYARRAWYVWWFAFLLAIVLATLAFSTECALSYRSRLANLLLYVAMGPVAWLFAGQVDVVLRLKVDQDKATSENSQFINFYRKLVPARDATAETGIRESYSHLREHANSVFIAVIELSLLATLVVFWRASNDVNLFAIWCLAFLLLWISPNVLLWGLANALEGDMARHPSKYTAERPD